MKTIITSIGLVVALILMNIGTVSAENIYKTENMDEATNTLTVTICKGNEGQQLSFYKKHTIEYNDRKQEKVKTYYQWDGYQWEAVKKYNYEYDNNGQLSSVSVCNWNQSTKGWSKTETAAITFSESNPQLLANE